MAIDRAPIGSGPAQWYIMPDRFDDVVYGICVTENGWLVLKKEYIPNGFGETRLEVVARAPTRAGAIGFLKLLKEQ